MQKQEIDIKLLKNGLYNITDKHFSFCFHATKIDKEKHSIMLYLNNIYIGSFSKYYYEFKYTKEGE